MIENINKKSLVTIYAVFTIILSSLLSSCGGGSDIEPVLISEIVIFVPDNYKSPLIDQTFQLKATGIYRNSANSEVLTSKAKWQSDNPDVASVSTTGEVSTKKAGTATVTVLFSGVSSEVTLTISPPPSIDSMSILTREDGYIIIEGSSLFLVAESTFSNEDISQDNELYTWTSSNEEIATVDETGRVIGISPGEVNIKAIAIENELITAEISATVKAKLSGISPGGGVTYVELGVNVEYIVQEDLSDGSSNPIPTQVKWDYDVEDTVRITSTGQITSTNLGIVNATATYFDFELTQQIIVEDPIELFVVDDTNGFIKLAWHAKHDATSYTLFWNNGEEGEEDKVIEFDDPATLSFIHKDIDISKAYNYKLAYTRNDVLSEPSLEMKVWTHTGKWQFREVLEARTLAAGASYQENMYLIGGEVNRPIKANDPSGARQQFIIAEVWEYNIIKNKWTKESSLETPLRNATACSVDEFIYVIGGENEQGNVVTAVHVYNSRQNQWEFNVTDLPVALKQVSCNILNGMIYVSGGHDNTNPVATTYRYEIETKLWDDTLPALNVARFNHSSTLLNDKIYVAGGSSENDIATATVEVFDPSAETPAWNLVSAMENPRTTFALHQWNNKLQAIGGVNNNDQLVYDTENYDPDTDTWESTSTMVLASADFNSTLYKNELYLWQGSVSSREVSEDQSSFMRYSINDGSWIYNTSINAARYDFNAVMIDEFLYLIGGADPQKNPSTDLRAYNTNFNSWDKLSSLNTPRQRASAVAYKKDSVSRIYVLGGINDGVNLKSMEVYDVKENTWESKRSMEMGRSYAAVTLHEEKIYIFGGENRKNEKPNETFEIYDTKRNVWQTIGRLNFTRSHATAISLNSKIYLIGGIRDGQVSDKRDVIDVYTPASDTWEEKIGTLSISRNLAGSTLLNGRVYTFGGIDKTGKTLQSAEVYTPFNNDSTLLPSLPNKSLSAQGGSYKNKIYLISEEGFAPDVINNIYVFE